MNHRVSESNVGTSKGKQKNVETSKNTLIGMVLEKRGRLEVSVNRRLSVLVGIKAYAITKDNKRVALDKINSSLLKSAIQKQIRQGKCKDLFQTLLLCYILCAKEVSTKLTKPAHKAWITNVVNRLYVSCIEDVGIGCTHCIVALDKLLKEFVQNVMKPQKMNRQIELLLSISKELGNPRIERTREISFLRAAYFTIFKFPNVLQTYKDEDYLKPILTHHVNNKDSNNLKMFKKFFDEGNEICFFYFFKELEKSSSKNKGNITSMIEHVKYKSVDSSFSNVFNVLSERFKVMSLKEYWIFAAQIILIGLRKLNKSLGQSSNSEICFPCANQDTEELVLEVLDREWIVDFTCFDRHTKGYPNIANRTLSFFATDASAVTNESKKHTTQLYKEIYVALKQEEDRKQKKPQKRKRSQREEEIESESNGESG